MPKTVTRQRRGCDLNPGPSAPESSTLTAPQPSHPYGMADKKKKKKKWVTLAVYLVASEGVAVETLAGGGAVVVDASLLTAAVVASTCRHFRCPDQQ